MRLFGSLILAVLIGLSGLEYPAQVSAGDARIVEGPTQLKSREETIRHIVEDDQIEVWIPLRWTKHSEIPKPTILGSYRVYIGVLPRISPVERQSATRSIADWWSVRIEKEGVEIASEDISHHSGHSIHLLEALNALVLRDDLTLEVTVFDLQHKRVMFHHKLLRNSIREIVPTCNTDADLQIMGWLRADDEYENGWPEIDETDLNFFDGPDVGLESTFCRRHHGCFVMFDKNVEWSAHNQRLRELVADKGIPERIREFNQYASNFSEYQKNNRDVEWIPVRCRLKGLVPTPALIGGIRIVAELQPEVIYSAPSERPNDGQSSHSSADSIRSTTTCGTNGPFVDVVVEKDGKTWANERFRVSVLGRREAHVKAAFVSELELLAIRVLDSPDATDDRNYLYTRYIKMSGESRAATKRNSEGRNE